MLLSRSRSIAAMFLSLALWQHPGAAKAEPDAKQKALAETLFQEAVDLMGKKRASEACPKFDQVVQITEGLGAKLELARCYAQIGKTASAWGLFREVASRSQGDRARDAAKGASDLESKLARLTVTVPPEVASLEGLQIKLDGKPLDRALWGTAMPVDPGDFALEATATGKAPWTKKGSVAPESRVAEAVPPLSAASAGPVATTRPAPTEGTEAPKPAAPSSQRTIGLIVGGVGLVAAGVGGFLALGAKSKYDEQRDKGACNSSNVCTAEGHQASEDARSRGTLATIVGGVGLAALVGGAVLFFTAPSSPPTTARVQIVPSFSPRASGLSALVSW